MMRALFIALGLAFACTPAFAQTGPKHQYVNAVDGNGSRLLLDNVALNGAASTRTFNLRAGSAWGYSVLALYHFFDYDANAGTLTTACTATLDTQDYDLTTCATSSGTCTVHFAGTWTLNDSLSADKRYMIPIGITGAGDVECSVTHNGSPGADDKIEVKGVLVAQ